ncbi:MAG: ABC transporter permease [Ectothiorhodospiraceae bacterium]|nr:ABC transporter permease [Chromatiales bacterium]MCP5157396.1 ABC transporter permease [Ectothiorhodospiraceae bacterium]
MTTPSDLDAPPRSRAREVADALRGDRATRWSAATLALVLLAALAGEILIGATGLLDPATVRLPDKLLPPLSAPSATIAVAERPGLGIYLLGTDDLGRDVFARMLEGSAVTLTVGFVAVAIAISIGVAVGSIAGYLGQVRLGPFTVDGVLMRFTDVMLCFPTFFLILTAVALLPPSIYNIMVVIGLTGWMGTARFVRAEVLSLARQDFVLAARALGLPPTRVIVRHLLPNAAAPVLVTATVSVASAILVESSLSFLGFGVPPPHATWGNILSDGKDYVFDAPWLFTIPGLAILAVVLAFNLLGEGLREALDPRLRRR